MTTTQVQSRRDTAANLNAATPAAGEVGYDTTNKRLVVGDGSTLGGIRIPSAKDEQNGAFVFGTVGGTGNAITLTHTVPVLAYTNGLLLRFKATSSNTGATTVNVDGLGTKNVLKMLSGSLTALSSGDIASGGIYYLAYDGTQFQLIGSAGGRVASVKSQVFTSSGTYTPPTGMLYCIVEAEGGSGGGGQLNAAWGGGGGGAEYVLSRLTASDIGASKTVTIGAAGAHSTSIAAATAGGDTSLGSLVIAKGGAAPSSTTGGAGGTGGTGDFKMTGQSGGNSAGANPGARGGKAFWGYGGSSAVSAAAGTDGTAGRIYITEFCSV